MMKFNEFSMISIKSGLMIERLNHIITAPRGSYFYSTRLSLHIARYHWWIVRPINIILMIDDSRRIELELFQSIEKSFNDIMMKIIIYLTIR